MQTKFKIPHTYVIVFYVVIFSAVLTWLIPGGTFDREKVMVNGTEREVIINDSFHYIDHQPQTWEVFSAIFDGFVDKADIIIFILMIGGAFWIMNHSKALDVGILAFVRVIKKMQNLHLFRFISVDNFVLVFIMLIFSVFGATFGMSEETIAFVIIFIPLAISMGYDSIIGVCLCFVAAGLGFAGALLNPFTIGIAQGLSGLPLFSGIEYRMICWLAINIVGFTYILRYAKKIKKNPLKSPVYQLDEFWRKRIASEGEEVLYVTYKATWIIYAVLSIVIGVYAYIFPFSELKIGNVAYNLPIIPILLGLFVITGVFFVKKSAHFFVLNLLFFTIFFLIVGVMAYHWYVGEIATLFFVMGLASGIAMNYSPNNITKLFIDGMKDIMSAAVIVGLAGGIIILLQRGMVIDTILYSVSKSLGGMSKMATVSAMYGIQNMINLIMPSGSAKAALTMPMMSQFSDLVGLSRQATVMAFQFGDGFTNMITPTSGVLLGVLSVAKIPYEKWFKWILPLMIILILLGLILLIPTVMFQLNGF